MNQQLESPAPNHAALIKRGRKLEYFTIGYNCLEGLVAVGAGLMAGSVALLGFGVDSFIEYLSGGVLLWRLHDNEKGEAREALALRLVGVSFLILRPTSRLMPVNRCGNAKRYRRVTGASALPFFR